MSDDVTIVAKALDDFGDDWHWVVLHGAEPSKALGFHGAPGYFTALVDTICGIRLYEGRVFVELNDTGAPAQPTCERCLTGDGAPGGAAAVAEVMRIMEQVPALA